MVRKERYKYGVYLDEECLLFLLLMFFTTEGKMIVLSTVLCWKELGIMRLAKV